MMKKPRLIFRYLKNEKSLYYKTIEIFIIFKGLSLKQMKKIFLEGQRPNLIFKVQKIKQKHRIVEKVHGDIVCDYTIT